MDKYQTISGKKINLTYPQVHWPWKSLFIFLTVIRQSVAVPWKWTSLAALAQRVSNTIEYLCTNGFSNTPLSPFVTIQSAIKGWNRKTILYFRENVHFREISRTPIAIMLYLRQISKFFKIKIKVREYHNKLFAEACKFYRYILFPILFTLQE